MSPRRRTILCVDDNAALVDNLSEILEDASFAVRRAASCAEALAQAGLGFDVALVDVKLPDGDGTALATRLRERLPDSQVILLTGFATLESAVAAVRPGAWAYLLKPCATPICSSRSSKRSVRSISWRKSASSSRARGWPRSC